MNTTDYLIQDSKAHMADEEKKINKHHVQRLILEHLIREFNEQEKKAVNRARSW